MFQPQIGSCVNHAFSISAKRYWCKKHGANPRIILPTPLQQAFANKQIVCVEYDSLSEEQEREIFQVCPLPNFLLSFTNTRLQRVQLGVALTPAGV